MLSRQNRLTVKGYKELKKGEFVNTPLFRIKIIKNQDKIEISKLGIIISKKNIKKAVDRNKLYRQICYAYKDLNLNKSNNTYIITFMAKNLQKLPKYQEIKENLSYIQ